MNDKTNTLIAKFYLGETSPRDFSDWAVSCLEQGLDTKNIRILAAMFDVDSFSEINDYFQRALKELDWNFPEKEECLKRYAKSIAQQIIDKKIEPSLGCGLIHNIYYSLDYADYLSNWNGLFWGYEDFPVEEIDSKVIQKAKRLISGKQIVFSENLEEKPILSDYNQEDRLLIRLWRRIFSAFYLFLW